MDEQGRISAAFRAAAADPPPPGFDAGDVVAASRRITRRRRAALAGAVVAVLAVAGVGTAAGFAAREPVTAAAAGAPEAASEARVAAAPEAAPDVAGGPDAGSSAGAGGRDAAAPLPGTSELASPSGRTAGPPPVGVPLGPGTRGCADRQDPALRALVEQALPEVAGAPEAATTTECRPGGERGVALEVRDGGSTGLLSVTSLPPGTAVAPAPGARAAPTASGGTVLVVARADPAGGPPPFADRLDAVVAYLAPRL
jgi:hypothetical protein